MPTILTRNNTSRSLRVGSAIYYGNTGLLQQITFIKVSNLYGYCNPPENVPRSRCPVLGACENWLLTVMGFYLMQP